jgi:hypothetical protein
LPNTQENIFGMTIEVGIARKAFWLTFQLRHRECFEFPAISGSVSSLSNCPGSAAASGSSRQTGRWKIRVHIACIKRPMKGVKYEKNCCLVGSAADRHFVDSLRRDNRWRATEGKVPILRLRI